jgi:uncharacterized repeat protein (TIGR03806 family)
MRRKLLLCCLAITFAFSLFSCTSGGDNDYEPVSPVVLDVTQVPYAKLSDYKFFTGEMKNLEPAYKVIPFKPHSELFSDYALKKRFVWMPAGASATYNGDGNVLEFPVGAVLIKNFYYDDVLPDHTQKIIETRLLVRVATATDTDSGWRFYDYQWNGEQTEAFLDMSGAGGTVTISFMENGVEKDTDYHIPTQEECFICHSNNHGTADYTRNPIGPKPQNLNFTYDYGTSQRNQLEKLQSVGYLDNTLPALASIHTTADWKDESQPLEIRARSYLDANCAHCHRDGGNCENRPIRLDFGQTDLYNLGVCQEPFASIGSAYPYQITAGNANRSAIVYRMSSTDPSEMMPLVGRTLTHDEGIQVIKEWINGMPASCP